MRKVFAVLLCGVMLAVVWSVPAFAEYWNEGRSGNSWEDAYVIDSVEDFIRMKQSSLQQINAGKYFVLVSDIDLTSQTEWFGYSHFTGHFDGQGHTIRINSQENVLNAGLFYSVSSVSGSIAIRNLNVTGNVSAAWGGAIVCMLRSGIVENCSFTGTLTQHYPYYDGVNGGIVAQMSGGTVRNCRVNATIEGVYSAGGIVGIVLGSGTIENCTVSDNTTISADDKVGGIAGHVNPNSSAILSGNTWPSQYPEIGNDYTPNTTPAVPDAPDSPAPGGDTPPASSDTPPAPAAPVSSDIPASPTSNDTPSGNNDPSAPPVAPAPQNNNSTPAAPEGQTTTSPLPRGTIQPVTLAPSVLEKVAQTVSIDVSRLRILTSENISAPQEPTQAMRDYIKGDNAELIGKLNTISVNESGYYVFKITLTDELFEQVKGRKVSDFKFYGLHDSEAQARASFITGLFNTVEALTLTGSKLESFGVKEFLMVGFLNAGTPFSVYITKIILALLAGGCNTGIFAGGLAVLALTVILFRKH